MLVIVSGYMNNTEVAVDALSIWFDILIAYSAFGNVFPLDFASN